MITFNHHFTFDDVQWLHCVPWFTRGKEFNHNVFCNNNKKDNLVSHIVLCAEPSEWGWIVKVINEPIVKQNKVNHIEIMHDKVNSHTKLEVKVLG